MSRIIAGIYEIERPLGSGGVGTAYLGWHMRLNKQIVLKADRRTLATKPESLRREVDMLKGLSHTYIPQVYDFVEQDGVVYTVMDYIDGESLDKPLKRGERFVQPQVIRWACQLLEALCYLHSRPPYGILHGDIKPANIMLRPNGDICLIDFNIALALGENGAVKAGSSRGYASPEQYGSDSFTMSGSEITQTMSDPEKTETMSAESSGSSSKGKLLDARSDIYSLGATLYHLLSGVRPSAAPEEVSALGKEICSGQVSDIIRKAMMKEPEKRYQTAEEMLDAFRQLYQKDERTIGHRKRIRIAAAALGMLFVGSGICALIGSRQMGQIQEALALAEYSAGALRKGNIGEATSFALQAIPEEDDIFSGPLTAEAQKALTDALGVYELSDGFHALNTVMLSAEPFCLSISPQGTYFAAVSAYKTEVYETKTQRLAAELETRRSALADVIFEDETHIIYASDKGIAKYDLESKQIEWTGDPATALSLSEDRTSVAAIDKDADHAVIYRTKDGSKKAEYFFDGRHMQTAENDLFADPENSVFELNGDGSILAISFSDGSLSLFDELGELPVFAASEYEHFEGGFCGSYFAVAAYKGGESVFGMVDTENEVYQEGHRSGNILHLEADSRGVYLSDGNVLVFLNPGNGEEKELAYTADKGITGFSVGDSHCLVTTENGGFSFYNAKAEQMSVHQEEENWDFAKMAGNYAVLANRNSSLVRIMELQDHKEAMLLKYDPGYEHDEARISEDRKTAMIFGIYGFQIYDMNGKLLEDEVFPEPGKIYDQQFEKDGEDSRLKVIWYDGVVRYYSAKDGRLLSEEQGKIPEKDLYEEFFTDHYRIASSLHEPPKVYDRESGKFVGMLEEEAYLTYVTQMGEYLITEYVSAEGERYGLLLNKRLETLAYLPNLCDVSGEMLVVDDKSGNLRQSRLYSIQELIALGENKEIQRKEKGL